jgi:hypothetical protein
VTSQELKRMCHDKRVYLDRVTAGIKAGKVLKKHGFRVRPYRCRNCNFYHLTSKH